MQIKVDKQPYYNQYSVEVIDMMERVYGKEKTAIFCELNAFKYRMRIGVKADTTIQEDLAKEKYYLNKVKELSLRPVVKKVAEKSEYNLDELDEL